MECEVCALFGQLASTLCVVVSVRQNAAADDTLSQCRTCTQVLPTSGDEGNLSFQRHDEMSNSLNGLDAQCSADKLLWMLLVELESLIPYMRAKRRAVCLSESFRRSLSAGVMPESVDGGFLLRERESNQVRPANIGAFVARRSWPLCPRLVNAAFLPCKAVEER